MLRIYYVLVTNAKNKIILKYENTDFEVLVDDFNFLYGLEQNHINDIVSGKKVVLKKLNFFCTYIDF